MPKDGEFCKTFEIFRNLKKNKNGGISKKGLTLLVIFEKITAGAVRLSLSREKA